MLLCCRSATVEYSLIFTHQLKYLARNITYNDDLHGITRDSATEEYALVLDFKKDGSIRDFHRGLHNQPQPLISDWIADWIWTAQTTARDLADIHRDDLLHGDLHSGNAL